LLDIEDFYMKMASKIPKEGTGSIKKRLKWYKNNRDWWEKQRWMREIPIISATGNRELH